MLYEHSQVDTNLGRQSLVRMNATAICFSTVFVPLCLQHGKRNAGLCGRYAISGLGMASLAALAFMHDVGVRPGFQPKRTLKWRHQVATE